MFDKLKYNNNKIFNKRKKIIDTRAKLFSEFNKKSVAPD